MRMSLKAIVALETLISWIALALAAAIAFFAFAPSPEDFSPPSIGFGMAFLLVSAAGLLHFSAGHLEKHGKILAPLHLVPLALIGLTVALPRIAA